MHTSISIPEPCGGSVLDHALQLAAAGCYVGPIAAGGGKHPGSVLGKGWPAKTSRDPAVLHGWFTGTPFNLFIHAGRSGLVAFDVDVNDWSALPVVLQRAIAECSPPYQSSRDGMDVKGHYLFALAADQMFGNSNGRLPKDWGEVRGKNGVIVAAPSVHAKVEDGGLYQWGRVGPVPLIPDYLAAELTRVGDGDDVEAVDGDQVVAFAGANDRSGWPDALQAVCTSWNNATEAGGARHDRARDHALWVARDAQAGAYPALTGWKWLREQFLKEIGSDRSVSAEWDSMVGWAVGACLADPDITVEARRARLTAGFGAEAGVAGPDAGEAAESSVWADATRVLREPTGSGPLIVVKGDTDGALVMEHTPAEWGVLCLADDWSGGVDADVLRLGSGRAVTVCVPERWTNGWVWDALKQACGLFDNAGAVAITEVVLHGQTLTESLAIGRDSVERGTHMRRLLAAGVTPVFTDKGRKALKKTAKDAPRAAGVLPGPGEPAPAARAYLDAVAGRGGVALARYWRDTWVHYEAERGYWVESKTERTMRDRLNLFFENAICRNEDGQPVAWNPSPSSVSAVEDQLKSYLRLGFDTDAPCWIDREEGTNYPDPRDFLAFPNGLYHVPTRKFIASMPNLFTLYGMRFEYDAAATIEGTRWFKFLGELFPDDAESVSRLQEIMGYLLSGRTGMEKLFLLLGVKRAGKGTIGRVLESMHSAAVGTSVRAMTSGNFALQPLLNKKIAVVGDARGGSNPGRLTDLVEDLLMISGGDHVSVARKNKTTIDDKPMDVNFLIMSNEMPILSEASGALAERFEVIRFEQTFADRPDIHLKEELTRELAAVFNWAMDGLERFDRQGERFTRSARAEEEQEDIRTAGSPKLRFAADELDFDKDGWTLSKDLFWAWRVWADQHGEAVGSDVHFSRDMKTVFGSQWGARTRRTDTRSGKFLWGRDGVILRNAGANAH